MGSQRALDVTPAATEELHANARALELRLTDLSERLNGDRTRASRQEPDLPGIASRVNQVVFGHWRATYGPTQTHREQYQIAADLFSDLYNDLEDALEVDLTALEDRMEAIGAPWTPGRGLPDWP